MHLDSTGKPRRVLRLWIAPSFAVAALLVLLGLLRGSGIAQAATTRTYPTGSAPCNTTLQACIDGSAAGDTINIAAGTFITTAIVVNKSMTLTGAGPSSTILNALPNQRVISVSANLVDGVVIANLRITGGNVNGSGGGLRSGAGTPLKLVNVLVRDNIATAAGPNSGGGALVEGPLTLIDTSFINNQAPNGAGGGLRASSSVTVVNGRFERNISLNPGGGLRVDGLLVMQNTVVISNATTNTGVGLGNGGGVRADGGLSMTGGEVRANSSRNDGGGIYVVQPATVNGTLVISNSADNGGGVYARNAITLENVQIRHNVVLTDGGGLYAEAKATLTGVEFTGNKANGFQGGGAYVVGSATVAGGSQFRDNRALFGGGLRVEANAQVTDAHFENNVATGDGGGLFANGEFVTVTASSFISNSAGTSAGGMWAEVNAVLLDTEFFSNTAGATGGGLQVNGGTGSVTGGRFEANLVGPDDEPGDEQGGGGIFAANDLLKIDGVTFLGNSSVRDGGALMAYGSLAIAAGLFQSNTASFQGGAIYQESGAQRLDINASTFARNESDFGGGIYTYATLAITDTDFLTNTGNTYGGGMFTTASGTIVRGRLAGNRTTFVTVGILLGGGGIYNDSGTLTIDGAEFVENESAQQGGALLGADGPSAKYEIANALFKGNRAQSGAGVEGEGAITLVDSSFVDNVAEGVGGGVNGLGPLVITGVSFRGNEATYGGGVAASGVATVTNSGFFTNNAISEGGALASSGHSLITSSEFDSNEANLGGALWLGILNGNAVDRSRFTRNSAVVDGGAIFVNDSTALTLTNSVFVGNTAGNEGGGIANTSAGLHVLNVTLTANQADAGGGIMARNSALDLGNSILWGNSPDQIGQTLPLSVVGPNLIQGGAFSALDQDPLFVRNPVLAGDDMGDLRLRQQSPAIDRGDSSRLPNTLTFDLDGLPRRFDVTGIANTGSGTPPIDLGAHEVNNQLPTAQGNGAYAGNEGTPIPMTASGSTSGDAGQAITSFAWDCTDDGIIDVTAAQPTGSSCLYADQGSFTLRLRVTDAGGFSAESTAAVTVQNVAPTLTGPGNQNAEQNLGKLFGLASFADPGPDSPWQVTVAWGDGQSSSFARSSTGALPETSHTYTAGGTFSATVTVTDKDGGADNAGFVVSVQESAPVFGEVEGNVVVDTNGNGEADSGEPALVAASVILTGPDTTAALLDASMAALARRTITDDQGTFRFEDVTPGSYELSIAKEGHLPIGSIAVEVLANQLIQVGAFGLTPVQTEETEEQLFLPSVQR